MARRLQVRLMQSMSDLKFAFRQLLKNPGFTAVAGLSVALGIAGNTAIFSLLDALLLKRLPVQQPEQLVVVAVDAPGLAGISSFSFPVFRELREQNSVFCGMFAHDVLPMSLSGGGQTERVLGELVSGSFFGTLGVAPHLGRVFTAADDQTPGAHALAVLSYNCWQRRFGADPQIVGQTMSLNGYPFTVIGITAPGFHGVEVGVSPDVRIPVMMNSQVRLGPPVFENRGNMWLGVMARLKPGVCIERAQAATDIIFQIIREPDVSGIKGYSPDDRIFKSLRIHLDSAQTGASHLSRQFSEPLIVLMCLVLGFLPQGRIPTVLEIKPDLRLLGFTLGVTMLTGLLFGLAPAILATRPDLIPALKNDVVVVVGGRSRTPSTATSGNRCRRPPRYE